MVAALTVGLVVLAPVSAASAARAPTSGFVSRTGTQLVVGGKPWRFAGYNLPCANPFLLTSAQLGYYLNEIKTNSGANAVRLWFFQSQGGPGNWAHSDAVMSVVRAHGMRAILTLTNETNACDEPSPTAPAKTLGWYQSGYRSPEGGYRRSYRNYAIAVAAHYAAEPAVAFWQLVNEASAPTLSATGQMTCDNSAGMTALRTFSDDMAAALHTVDPRHLVDLGTRFPGDCGIGDQASYRYVHAGGLDLCEYHDYGAPAVARPDGLQETLDACRPLGKPTFVGEAGIPADVQPDGTPGAPCAPWPACNPPTTIATLDQRAAFFKAKMAAANHAGVAGYVIWVKSPFYTDTSDGYAIGDGDPVERAMSTEFSAPVSVGTLPQATQRVLALSGLGVVAGLAVVAGGIMTVLVMRARRQLP